MHGIAFGWIVPCVVHVAWLNAGFGTTVKLKRERSPSGILNDTDAEAFAVSVGGVSISTTAEPTNPHPRPEFVEPLRRVTIRACIPAGPVNVKPFVGSVRSTELPQTSNCMFGPAMTVNPLVLAT
jgi:hypothetical protein